MKRKHPFYQFINPIVFLFLCGLILFEGATPGSKSSSQSSLLASLFDFGKKEAAIIAPESFSIIGEDVLYLEKTNTYDVQFLPLDTSDKRVHYEIVQGKEFASLDGKTLTGLSTGDVVLKATSLVNSSLVSEKTIHVEKEPIRNLVIEVSSMEVISNSSFQIYLSSNVNEISFDDVVFLYDEDALIEKGDGIFKTKKAGKTILSCYAKKDATICSNQLEIQISEGNYVSPTSIDYTSEISLFANEEHTLLPIFNTGCTDTLFGIREGDKEIKLDEKKILSFSEIGKKNLTIYSKVNPEIKKEIVINILSCKAKSITISLGSIQYGRTSKLSYSLESEKEGVEVTNPEVGFISDDKTIATIDENGYLLGYQKGKVNITVYWKEDEKISSTVSLTITSMESSKYDRINYLVRKILGHFLCFAATGFFGYLTVLAFFFENRKKKILSLSSIALIGLVLAFLSEFLQIFAGQRGPSFQDVMIDFSGYLSGMVLVFLLHLLISKIRTKKKIQKDDSPL